jgi:hypothetical protein
VELPGPRGCSFASTASIVTTLEPCRTLYSCSQQHLSIYNGRLLRVELLLGSERDLRQSNGLRRGDAAGTRDEYDPPPAKWFFALRLLRDTTSGREDRKAPCCVQYTALRGVFGGSGEQVQFLEAR